MITVPYDLGFNGTGEHLSNRYVDASLPAPTDLANKKRYSLVGTNSAKGYAFFVTNDLVAAKLQVLSAEDAYTPTMARETRGPDGRSTHVRGDERIRMMQGRQAINVAPETAETFSGFAALCNGRSFGGTLYACGRNWD